MNTKLLNFLQETYDFAKTNNWTLKDIISEITFAGFSNEEIGIMLKEVLRNDTFLTCVNK
jgi:hypothetical protein